MGRTAEPRSWRQRAPRCPSVDSTAAESDPGASTSSISAPPLSPQAGVADNQNTTRPTPSLVPLSLDNWFLRDGSPLASSSNVVTEQLRRSVLPASTPNDSSSERIAEAAAWQSTTTTTSIGGLSVDNDHHNSTDVDLSNTRISRSARASWYAAFNNDTQDFPDSSTMLPPRLGTPVPVATASSPATAAAITPANSLPASSHRTLERALEEGLTSTGRRALARHRLRTLEAERQNTTVGTVSSLDVRTIERAQAAVEASRIALEQARQAIRMALRDSESRLGRLADLIRSQLQNESADVLPSLPGPSERVEDEHERTEYNLEQSLRALRTASLEIDRVLASSQNSPTRSLEAVLQNAIAPTTISPTPSGTEDGDITGTTASHSGPIERHSSVSSPHTAASSVGSILVGSSDSILRQSTPRRPVRHLRGSTIPSLPNLRSRMTSTEAGTSRSNRPQRSPSNRSLAVQVSLVGYANDSTSNLARNVLTNLSHRTITADEDATSGQQDDDVIEPSVRHSRSTGYRQLGRWLRLDANGDEIVGSHDNSRVPLGWTWAVVPSAIVNDEEKLPNLATMGSESRISAGGDLVPGLTGVSQRNYDLVGR